MGRCAQTTGIAPLGRVVQQGLAEEPYRSGARLLGIVAKSASHRGDASKQRLRQVDVRIMLVHTKVLTPKDLADLEAVRLRLALYEALAHQPQYLCSYSLIVPN